MLGSSCPELFAPAEAVLGIAVSPRVCVIACAPLLSPPAASPAARGGTAAPARRPPPHPSSLLFLQPQHPAAGLGAQRGGKAGSSVPLPSPAFLGSETQELAGHSCFLWPPLLRCLNKALLPLPGTWGLKQERRLVLRGNALLRHILGSVVGGGQRWARSPRGAALDRVPQGTHKHYACLKNCWHPPQPGFCVPTISLPSYCHGNWALKSTSSIPVCPQFDRSLAPALS